MPARAQAWLFIDQSHAGRLQLVQERRRLVHVVHQQAFGDFQLQAGGSQTALREHAGESVSKGRLLASVWGYDFDPGSNVVDVCVRRLRSKLGFNLIKTVRGEGYQLADS